jgi:formate dehydrogenase assembly factor FdhD
LKKAHNFSHASSLEIKAPEVLPQKRILTSGCGGGVSLNTTMGVSKIKTDISVAPKKILQLMRDMIGGAELYNLTGGIHTSALCDDKALMVVGEILVSIIPWIKSWASAFCAKYPLKIKSC